MLSPISFTRQYHNGQLIIIHIIQTYLFILVSLLILPALPGQIRHPHRLLVTSAKHFSTSVSFLIQQEVAAVSRLSDVDIITQDAHGMMIMPLLCKTMLWRHFHVIMTLFFTSDILEFHMTQLHPNAAFHYNFSILLSQPCPHLKGPQMCH